MKITIEDEGFRKRRVEVETDATALSEVIDEIRGLLLAWGFHPDNVEEYLGNE